MTKKRFYFEVFGKVQGVYFRNYIVEKAKSLSIVGWCRNTANGSVEIEAEGSPLSRVDNIIAKEISVINNEECMVRLKTLK
ncbi:hypothetical protein MERGE_000911 [Pneumocystis wakefieldiae]|uniref:Acylphosphatase n=1 Tax=Pneumocystis wakefieldiae TaxID=38082 RepID=A0A899FXK8_9ASCO|nr:hypothetical protein MERGE_000911 [Pneumocystis wakefieldiae]